MLPLTAQFCVGCGQVLDDLQPSESRPCWITAHAYREKYGFLFTDLHLIGDACPKCVHEILVGPREAVLRHCPTKQEVNGKDDWTERIFLVDTGEIIAHRGLREKGGGQCDI